MNSYPDYLEHHGILGMKWGVRRYQNEDGTRTAAGKKRYATISKALDDTIPQGKGKPNISTAEKIGRDTVNIATSSNKLVDTMKDVSKKRKQKRAEIKEEAESMSDAELRKRINRIQMEKQYIDLKSSDLDAGYERVKDIIGVVGGVAAIATSSIGIVSAIRKLKG